MNSTILFHGWTLLLLGAMIVIMQCEPSQQNDGRDLVNLISRHGIKQRNLLKRTHKSRHQRRRKKPKRNQRRKRRKNKKPNRTRKHRKNIKHGKHRQRKPTKKRRNQKLGKSNRVFEGANCEWIDLCGLKSRAGNCSNGNKAVLKNAKGARKQFLIVGGKVLYGFVKKGEKFPACQGVTERTSTISCKHVDKSDVAGIQLPSVKSTKKKKKFKHKKRQAYAGNECEYVDLCSMTSRGQNCVDGTKFVLKASGGVRKQFLITNNKLILAFVKRGSQFADCQTLTDVTPFVTCKAVSGLSGFSLTGSSASTTTTTTVAGPSMVPEASSKYVGIKWCGKHKLNCPKDVSGLAEDTCLHKDKPCGTWCHSYWNIQKVYCKQSKKCFEEGSPEHYACRNEENNCGADEHFCRDVCQPNSEICSDFCEMDNYWGDCFDEFRCITPGYAYCHYTVQCQDQALPCTDPYGYSLDGGGETWFCASTDSCQAIQSHCNGTCVNEGLKCDDPDRRYLCEEEGVCKKTYETCGGKCRRPCFSSLEHYYCKTTGSCHHAYYDCPDGCSHAELYCLETDKCQDVSRTCYGECRYNQYKHKGKKLEQHLYCAATDSCTQYTKPCNGTCRPYNADPLPSAPTELCPGLDLCYVAEMPESIHYGNTCKATERCRHHELNCSAEEWICRGKCIPLSQPCNEKAQCKDPIEWMTMPCMMRMCLKTTWKHKCVKQFGGVFHNYRWCAKTQSCIPHKQPCNGKCWKKKPRLALCEAEGMCINIATLCQGKCLAGRIKCRGEDKCIHKNAVCNGVQNCADNSDEEPGLL